MKYKAVIFDLDGTLVNSIGGIALSVNTVLQNHGLPMHTIDDYTTFVGNGLNELIKKAFPQPLPEGTELNTLIKEVKALYTDRWDYGMTIYDGIEPLLDNLTSRMIPFAVNTNKDTIFSETIIEQLFSKWHFSSVIGGTSLTTLKPDPEGALYIAKTLDIAPEACVFLGDSEVDIHTATNAGMLPVSALWGFRSEKDLLLNGAQHLIRHPMELLDIFDQQAEQS